MKSIYYINLIIGQHTLPAALIPKEVKLFTTRILTQLNPLCTFLSEGTILPVSTRSQDRCCP